MNAAAQFDFSNEFVVTRDGVYPHKDACEEREQVIDRIGRNTMVAGFDAKAADPNFPGLLIDFDHFSYDPSKPSVAAGWISKLYNEEDKLMAEARWTPEGAQALRGGTYRLCSPVFDRAERLDINNHKRVRPISLESVALTNQPNTRGMQPISNRLMNREVMPRDLVFKGQRITNRHAADAVLALAQAHQRSQGESFTTSWDRVCVRFTALHAVAMLPNGSASVMHNRSFNPAQPSSVEEQERFWSAVEKAAGAVRKRATQAGCLELCGDDVASRAFWSRFAELKVIFKNDPGQAFDQVRLRFPLEWANYVLNSPEAQEYVSSASEP